ncbi:FAD-dependent oxidoreductase [bacterium]|nr:FAD-dependent oxidoreductase [bacterium]
MANSNIVDVIIVGAGPAGCACAIKLANAGIKVVVLERGNYAGAKNMFGGAVFSNVVEKLYPTYKQEAPIERIVTKHNYSLLSDDSSINITYNNYFALQKDNQALVVNRSKFDRWCTDKAKEAGAYFAYDTVVRELITDAKNKVIGIKTDNEEFFAPLTILADGANSLLAKQIGLRKSFKLTDEILSIKEVYEFESEEVMNQKFNLKSGEGSMYELIGGPLKNKFALGILYTHKKTLAIGLGVSMSDLIKFKQKPYELLDELKSIPFIYDIIKDGKSIEYSAHLIPESSPKTMPKLYSDGVMVIGDAAMLVNNLHFEGTNLAMMSGFFAAQIAKEAIEKQDFSSKTLKKYDKLIKNSFIYKDIKTYKNVMRTLHKNSDTFMGYYMDKMNEFFATFVEVDSIPKKDKYRRFILKFLRNINPFRLLKDIFNVIKLAIEAIF